MVVTRRAALNAMPTPSRTPSTQGSLRTNAHARRSALRNADDPDDDDSGPTPDPDLSSKREPDASPADDSLSPKKAGKYRDHLKLRAKKRVKRLRRRSKSCADFMSRVFIFFFLVYSFTVCPNDTELNSPVCRGLSEYRRLILEPYLFPPVQAALQHPAVAPYVNFVKPHFDTAVQNAAPIVKRAGEEWSNHVTPQWNKYVVPYWRKYASPYITLVEKHVDPYMQRVSLEYARYISPAVAHAQKWSRKARPYVIVAAMKTHDGYVAAKPYMASFIKQLQHLQPLFVRYILDPLNVQRRQFVDPHVDRIIEKVKELSRRGPKPLTTSAGYSSSSASSTWYTELVDETMASAPSVPPTPPPVDDAETASIVFTTPSSSEEVTSTDEVPAAETEVISIETAVPDAEYVETAFDFPPETAAEAEVVAQSALEEPVDLPLDASDVLLAGKFADSIPSVLPPAEVPMTTADAVTPSLVPEKAEEQTEIDLDEFYADLGLADEEEPEPPQVPSASPQTAPAAETEEQKAERLRLKALKTAEKRKDIEKRHAAWEIKLQDKVKEQRKILRKALVASRKQAAAALKSNKEIWDEVEKLHAETEKALKGSEAYFAKVKSEDRPQDEKMKLWERVLSKVQDKFEERLEVVQQVVGRWYSGVLDKEHQEVQAVSTEVKDFASNAQADIGMDYAWLDDVTYMDWQRYHALMEVHKEFLQQAIMIQNGSHPSPPIDPVGTALDELRSELQDLTLGFETRLRRIRREGERWFLNGDVGPEDIDESDEMDETGAAHEAESAGEVEEDAEDAKEDEEIEAAAAAVPEVSILPIPENDTPENVLEDITPLFIGRSEEEVADAFDRLEEQVQAEEVVASTYGHTSPTDDEPTSIPSQVQGEALVHEEL